MNIAVIGLGIIGGSFCKAIKKYTDHYVIGINRIAETAQKALEIGAIDEIGTNESLGKADIIILAMYPQADIDFIEKNGTHIKKGAIVTDASGIKARFVQSLKSFQKNSASFLSEVILWQAKKLTVLMFPTLSFIKMQAISLPPAAQSKNMLTCFHRLQNQ